MENTTNTIQEPGYTNPLVKRLTDSVRADLHNIFWALELQVQPTEYNTPLKDMGVDSLEYVELVLEIERHFKIEITESEMATLSTFNEITTLVCNKLTR